MFRSAVLRSASAARAAIRPVVAAQRTAFAAAPRASVMPKIQSFQAVRMYSAGGALNKDEVEGRIVSLLQGFDKVSRHPLHVELGEMRRRDMWSVNSTVSMATCRMYECI